MHCIASSHLLIVSLFVQQKNNIQDYPSLNKPLTYSKSSEKQSSNSHNRVTSNNTPSSHRTPSNAESTSNVPNANMNTAQANRSIGNGNNHSHTHPTIAITTPTTTHREDEHDHGTSQPESKWLEYDAEIDVCAINGMRGKIIDNGAL